MARTYFPAVPTGTASINVRLSKEAREENLSKEGMVEDCVRLAESLGLAVVSIHIDDGISGAVRNRPGFVAWLDEARNCRVDHLIAWHVDRMTREGVNVAGAILDTIEGKDPETGRQVRHPVRLLDTKGLDSSGDPTAFRFQFVIAAEVARAERERMRDRSRAARRRALAAGRWPGGPAPFGFRSVDNPDGAGKVIEHEPAEAEMIRQAASRVLAGETLSSVTRWANGPDGLPPRRARHWVRRTMLQVLTGHPVQGKVVTIVEGKPVPVIDEHGDPLTVPAILDPDTSAAVRARLAVRTPDARKGGRRHARLLSGLLRCTGCHTLMTVAVRTDRTVIYRCQEARSAGVCARPVAISATALDDHIERRFLSAHGSRPEMTRHAHVTGAAAVEAAEDAVTAALNALAEGATAERFQALQAAQAARDEALALPQETEVVVVPTGRTIAEAWEALDTAGRRDLIRLNYLEIHVLPGRRGPRGIDPARLLVLTQPVLAASEHADEVTRGRLVVDVED